MFHHITLYDALGLGARPLAGPGPPPGDSDSVLHEVKLVAGIGGGVGVDASKYVALKSGLAPTVVSTGAIPRDILARWEGQGAVGPSDSWPRTDFQYVVVGYGAVLSAPYYPNTARPDNVLCVRSICAPIISLQAKRR
jgi:hypothetical protein